MPLPCGPLSSVLWDQLFVAIAVTLIAIEESQGQAAVVEKQTACFTLAGWITAETAAT